MTVVRWLRWLVALAALTLTCLPSAIWHQPMTDLVQAGLDPNLDYTSAGASISRNEATLLSSADKGGGTTIQATVNLLSTPLRTWSASFHISVHSDGGVGQTFRIGLWSTFTGAGYFLQLSAGDSSISTQALAGGTPGPTLVGGEVTRSRVLGTFVSDQPYLVQIAVDRGSAISVQVAGENLRASDSVTAASVPDLFHSSRFNLTASAMASSGTSRLTLNDYVLTLPHQTNWANRVDDIRERIIFVAIVILGAVVVGVAGAEGLLRRILPWTHIAAARDRMRRITHFSVTRRRSIAVVFAASCVYLVGNSFLFQLGSHPFDMGNEKLYAYVARTYGPVQLYYLPNLVSLAGIWGGIPQIEAAFPYEPVTAYLFTGIGWIQSLLVGGGAYRLDNTTLEYVIKAVNVLFGLGDAALIYVILHRLGLSERWKLVAAGLFLFNPAVWFSMSVWGQTHVISLFFVLAAVLLAEVGLSLLAWLALAVACLTRPQLLVIGLLVGIVFLRKFTWTQNASALSWTVIIAFLALSPFTFFTSPSLPIDIMANVFRIQEAGGNEVALTTVSQGAYSIWPLVTFVAHGASGLGRAFTPSSESLIGPLTYQQLGQWLTLAAILVVSGALLFGRRAATQLGAYLPLVALGTMSFLMLSTGIVATHFLPFVLLCRRWMGGAAYFYVSMVWTLTTLVPMFGDMGIALSSQPHSLLAPTTNSLTRFFIQLYSWDRFITLAVTANICAVIWLGYLSLRPVTDGLTPMAAPS
jgi:hypothetical protein